MLRAVAAQETGKDEPHKHSLAVAKKLRKSQRVSSWDGQLFRNVQEKEERLLDTRSLSECESDSRGSVSPAPFEVRTAESFGTASPLTACTESPESYSPSFKDAEENIRVTFEEDFCPAKRSSETLLGRSDSEYLENEDSVYRFSLFWEAVLQPLDDPLLKACQFRTKGLVKKFSVLLTFLTAVEAGLNWPVVLYALGLDVAGRNFALTLFSLCLCSQVPKRWIFRPRPWMVGRGIGVRFDKTSSFPSRAAACAIVFPLMIFDALNVEYDIVASRGAVMLTLLLTVLSAGFARINVGAHYPSDIVGGVFLGWIAWAIGRVMIFAYGLIAALFGTFTPLEFRLPLAVIASFATTHLFMERFWAKCSFVFGLLFAALTFDFCFVLGEKYGSQLLRPLSVPTLPLVLGAFVCGLVLLGYGMKAHKKKGTNWQMILFAQEYCVSLAVLLAFRM
uniref:Phosphatidic acid phosphatase type 2/haloperoxidase domain-containing protein n=1 Tax=Timspurckia oligopyrenoides TaxID=708627 RepID=A0A7S0ZLG7_9RHOD|mmetsp:Transcript_9168/g.16493  ORF Transcript_9168/g.16493 Transcript_9168/m.16493 type:complete len:449 (+) Transcript_9168:320-1666(+)|eukprot:CAMPEP_0182448036 /NCGR_PEP_ID=MMETSP1172-20130603/22945_1 /TAXON_ID=708627 /ORGANISM="Timspurckia oligopyrenoides, Strain CCMP3278" /LENGTH=448 /DNA_ID=CAMNT_0024644741 /DNA_START=311 /DNA_END=1657 /DNA_ORIENTATION=+